MAQRRNKQGEVRSGAFSLPTGYLSPSQITSYLRCPRSYYYRYVEKLIIPPALALVEGSSNHKALETNNRHKIAKGKDLPVKQVVEAFKDDFATRKKEIEDWEEDSERNVLARGEAMLSCYMTKLAPVILPVSAEEMIMTEIGGVPIKMVIDLTENRKGVGLQVNDYKTVNKMKSQSQADQDLQLGMYGIEKKAKQVAFICLFKSQAARVERVASAMTQARAAIVEETIISVADAISRGAFPLCDSTIVYTCSERFCGYWNRCKGKRRKG